MKKIEEINWGFIDIPRGCRVLIYKHCVEEFHEAIKNIYPDAHFYNTEGKLLSEAVREAHVLAGWRFPDELLQKAVNLKWIQLISAGMDLTEKKYDNNNLINSNVVITTSKGIYSDAVADYAVWAILTLLRKFHLLIEARGLKKWAQHIGEDTRGKVVGILGFGGIGSAIAKRIKAFDMKVTAVKRNVASEYGIPDIDTLYPVTDLIRFLGGIDILVISLPLTSETIGLIGRNEFVRMKNSAFIIDVSRGGIVNHKDLMWAIKNKIISGAVLDVFEDEPLPKDSELWNLSNVIITPHIAGITADYARKTGSFFCKNLMRYIEGKDLINVINKLEGY